MGGRSKGGDRNPALSRRLLIAAICALALAVGLGASGGAMADRSKSAKATPPPKGMAPAAATRALALDLLHSKAGNVVISPQSIATALAMAGTGAAGKTAREMAEVLHLRGPAAFGDFGRLQTGLVRRQAALGEGHTGAPTLNMANGLFVQQGFPIKHRFLSGLHTDFGAAPELLDFWRDPSGATRAINARVSEQTEALIPELFKEELDEKTRLVLTNAIYLRAAWREPFDPARTAPGRFHGPSGPVAVDFMHQITRLRYGSGRDYQAVELPYKASSLSLLVVLPKGKDLAPFERRLDAGKLARIARGLSGGSVTLDNGRRAIGRLRVALSLPRFHLNTQTELNGTLQALGMPLAFSEDANFSRITGDLTLKIGRVVHAADLEVDEVGTVAAAATGVVIERKSKPITIPFTANHPFLFFLRDRKSGAILFAGRVVNPAAIAD